MKHASIGSALSLCISSLGFWLLWPDADESAAASTSAEPVAVVEPASARGTTRSPEPERIAPKQETDPQPAPHFAGTQADEDDGAASAAHLSGEVVGPDRLPIAGASIRAEIFAPELSLERQEQVGALEQNADEEGRFAFELSLGQEASLTVKAKGYASHVSVSHPAGEHCLIRLDRPASLAAEIVDDEGLPVSGARVSARPPHRDPKWAAQVVLGEATTDEHGKARLEGLPSGVCHVEVVPDRHQSFEQVVELTPGATTTRRWMVQLGTTFSGEVLDERTGLPLVDANVRCKNDFFAPRWDRGDHTDELGRFRIEGVSTQTPSFLVVHPGYVSAGGHLQMKADGTFSKVVALTPGRRVTGRFVDPDGLPAPDVRFVIATYEDDCRPRSPTLCSQPRQIGRRPASR
ncbi:MAG: carboxypeptidase-like regulatory domain-containing protein [Planctomycetota bacterium]